EDRLQHLEAHSRARSDDGVHDLLLRLGDLDREEIAVRSASPEVAEGIDRLVRARRALAVRLAGEERFIAAEHAAQFREAFGVALPPGLPEAFLAPPDEPLLAIVLRFARTHGPFAAHRIAERYRLAPPEVEPLLQRLEKIGKLLHGAFLPGEVGLEWCTPDVLTAIRRRSLARVRNQVEPVEPVAFARFLVAWQGIARPRRGLERLLDVIEQLAGCPLLASALDRELLPARVLEYQAADLDALAAAGEVVWVGCEAVGEHDGRVALYLTDQLPLLVAPAPATVVTQGLSRRAELLRAHLERSGASFFAALHEAAGGGYPQETADALWDLVWKGMVTNDSFRALRAYTGHGSTRANRRHARPNEDHRTFRSRRVVPPSGEGRWALVAEHRPSSSDVPAATARAAAQARVLLARYGLVSRGVANVEGLGGGFRPVYDVLRVMEEAGKVRRGYFAAGIGGLQFAMPAALELLRGVRERAEVPEVVVLSATDPANPYGGLLPWPPLASEETLSPAGRLARSAGAQVILIDGTLAAYLPRGGKNLWVFLPDDEADRERVGEALASKLAELGLRAREDRSAFLIEQISGIPASIHPLAAMLEAKGFVTTAAGLQPRGFRAPRPPLSPRV
ncbi:MAG: DEAD/DEAH box helicase, partial [Acidobacteriota bacterium]